MANPPKTLVIGSSGHQHATCVEWDQISAINVVDFDYVLISTISLTKEALAKIKAAALKGLSCHRADLAKILDMDNKSKLVGVVKRKCLRPDVA